MANKLFPTKEEILEIQKKKYQHIPPKYWDLCYEDDLICNSSLSPLREVLMTVRNNLFGGGTLVKGQSDNFIAGRMSKYNSILSEMKLKVDSSYWNIFESESNKMLSNVKYEIPSSWVAYSRYLEWCMNFVEYCSKNNSLENKKVEEKQSDVYGKKLDERLKFQEERKRNSN